MRDIIAELRGLATHQEREFTPGASAEYRAFDEMAVELEVVEFLYALVRATKPQRVVESGAGKGYSTVAIAGALCENGSGFLESHEPEKIFFERTCQRLTASDLDSWGCVFSGTNTNYDGADFVFLDSGPGIREKEIAHWLRVEGVLLVVHDAYRYPVLHGESGFFLKTPRGLWFRDTRK